MARNIRIEFEGAYYHVMARGNRREAIFHDDGDRHFFLKTLGEACERTGWRVHAWVLMNNHYHLLLETPEPNLVEGMKWLQNTFTRRINTKHGLWGRVFGDRYKAVLVEGGSPEYFTTLLDYIHLNPARAGLVDFAAGGSVLDYEWSSVRQAYAAGNVEKYPWTEVSAGLGAFGLDESVAGRREFVERLDKRAREEAEDAGLVTAPQGRDARLSHLRRGWYWGSREFAEQALKRARDLIGTRNNPTYRSGEVRRSHDLDEAERIVRGGLAALGLAGESLEKTPGSTVEKTVLACAVRHRTSVGLGWIADRLKMGSASNVSRIMARMNTTTGKKADALESASEKLSKIFD